MTNPAPSSLEAELDKVLEDYIMQKNVKWWVSRDRAKSQLKQLILKDVLAMIGQATWTGYHGEVFSHDALRAELIQSARKRYSNG